MKVLLLAGGDSSEREISLSSSRAVFDSLKRQSHEVLLIDPATGQSLLDADGRFPEIGKGKESEEVPSSSVNPTVFKDLMKFHEADRIDVVFIGLHGGRGENGAIQNLLDLAGMKYTGSGMTASAVAMNKALTKRLMASAGIPTPGWSLYHFRDRSVIDWCVERISKKFHFPVIVKPNDSGSTVGLSKVERTADLEEALKKAAGESTEILVENYIAGRELTVSVLDGESLPVVEIKPKKGLYDYEAKYTSGMSEYVAPAEIDDSLAEALKRDAARLYEIVGAAGLVRVDFIVDKKGDRYCLEMNTLPGMTDLSLAPMAAKCVGIDFDQLIDRILNSAINR